MVKLKAIDKFADKLIITWMKIESCWIQDFDILKIGFFKFAYVKFGKLNSRNRKN